VFALQINRRACQ